MKPRAIQANPAQPRLEAKWLWLGMFVVIGLVMCARVRLLDLPLERDEGEYAYAGQLILEGVPPYVAAYNMKLPGTYAAYAVIMAVFGQTAVGIRLGLLLVNLLTIWLVYRVGRKLVDSTVGITAAGAYAVLSSGPIILGMWAHATHFLAVAAMAGFLALLQARENGRRLHWFLAGLGFGTAFVMKQHGMFFAAFGVAVAVWEAWRNRSPGSRAALANLLACAAGTALPMGLTLLIAAATGSLEKLWFWTVLYASRYATNMPLGAGLTNFRIMVGSILATVPILALLAAAGGVGLFRSEGMRRNRGVILGWLLVSFLTICPGMYFRGHYFIPLLPGVALLVGIAGGMLLKRFARQSAWVTAGLTVGIGSPLALLGVFYFLTAGPDLTRQMFSGNPFVESAEVARYLSEHTYANDRIAVLGSEPQIYFLARRRSATGHIYAYGLMEPHPYARTMQEELAAEVERAQPAYLVLSETPSSWLVRPDSEKWIFEWMNRYVAREFELVGIGRVDEEGVTRMDWAGAGTLLEMSHHTLLVFRRKKASP